MKNLVLRTATGVAFVAVMVGGILHSALSLWALFLCVTVLTVWEFTGLVNAHAGVQVNRVVTTAAAAFLYVGISALQTPDAPHARLLVVPWLLSVVWLMAEELYLQRDNPLGNWAFAMLAQVYVALPFALLPLVGDATIVLAVFLFLWCSDTGAYCTGSLIGRHKLFPRISPGKTWEGSIGGGVVAIAASQLMAYITDSALTPLTWAAMALVVVVAGTLGDLVESLFKRRLGVKDSGNILPGHGGMLDRFDSSLLAIPAVWAFLSLVCAQCLNKC